MIDYDDYISADPFRVTRRVVSFVVSYASCRPRPGHCHAGARASESPSVLTRAQPLIHRQISAAPMRSETRTNNIILYGASS